MSDIQYFINIGMNIKRMREERNINQRELALRCNIDFQNLSRIERGSPGLTVKTLVKIAKGLCVKPEDLLKFKEAILP